MTQVNTVRGPIEGNASGSTLMHEHIFVLSPEIEKTAEEWDEAAEQARAVAKLRELKQHGIDTLVDLTVDRTRAATSRGSQRSPTQVPEINVVVATGVYTYNDVPMFFHFRGPGTILGGPEPMVDDLRARDPRGHRRDGRAGRHPQVRHRSPGHHSRRGARAASRGPGPPGHGRADHHAHSDTARALGTRAATHLQGGRVSTSPGSSSATAAAPSTPTTT